MADETGTRRRDPLDTVALLAFIVLCVAATWVLLERRTSTGTRTFAAAGPVRPTRPTPPSPPPLPTDPVSIADATNLGSQAAPVALIGYSEFKCPYCGKFARDTWPGLAKKYVDTGKVRFVFRHFPLDQLHPFAREAAKAAVCADNQGKFWALHDRMFANQAQLDAVALAKDLKTVGLSISSFTACMDAQAAGRVAADEATGRPLGVTGTPTFFIGLVQPDGRVLLRQRLGGAQPLAQFEVALDRWLGETERAK